MLGWLLDPFLGPILVLPPLFAILLLSFVITLLITLAYKYLTDQERMKVLKADLKKLQQQLKANQKNTEKALKIQQELMSKNMEYMKHSFRPTLFTMIPILIIFGWMNAHLAYYPLEPNSVFNISVFFVDGVSGNASLNSVPRLSVDSPVKVVNSSVVEWSLSGPEGKYLVSVDFDSGSTHVSHEFPLIISREWTYSPPVLRFNDAIKEVHIGNEKVKPLGSFSLFGWKPGWLGTYILSSIIFSLIIRKVLGVS